ncbi:hypothetical protein [Rugosimonospora africana]|uniref:Septum formation initiator n=1 Tax=Rugosimonospora africana TaxID=556532 RepID=A0A8J3QYU7_9ACTN|nr:hypothetical protein [Rugosimonospora africana]GIH19051.1 hypothetical protein Raf01_72230 [Rugosimonospora africana]
MRESTATTTRRSPARTVDRAAPPGARSVNANRLQFTTDGATALAPASAPTPAVRRGKGRGALRVAPPAPVTAPRAPFVALVLVVVVAGVLGILVLNTKINENAFRLAHLEDQQNTLDEQEQQLNEQLADDSSPTNLAALARAQGMVNAGQPAYITLPNGAVIGVPQPANGMPSVTGQQATTQTAANQGATTGAGH